MVKLGLLLYALVGASAARAQGLTKPVDYTSRAKPTSFILSDLSKKVGLKLTCTKELEAEPLIVKFQAVPLRDVMDKIAAAVAGDWRKQSDGFQLERGKKAEQMHAAVLQSYAEDFRAGVKQAAKDLQLDASYSSVTAKVQVDDYLKAISGPVVNPELMNLVAHRMPVARLLVRILGRMNPAQFVGQSSMTGHVFSNAPTSLQAALPNDLSGAIGEFESEQGVLDGVVNETRSLSKGSRTMFNSGSRALVDRILVFIDGKRGRYNTGIVLVDASGQIIANGSVDINGRADAKADAVLQGNFQRSEKVVATLGSAALDILPNIYNAENFHEVRADTKAVLLNPSETDPLAVATSDVVLDVAEKDHVGVALMPPDDCDSWVYKIGTSGKVSLAAFEQEAGYSKELNVSEDGGWLIGTPTDPQETTRERLSRQALEDLLRSLESTGKAGIDNLAHFETSARPDSNKVLASDSLMALYNANFYEILSAYQAASEPCLALFGTLEDRQKQLARDGSLKIPANELSEQQVTYLEEWLFAYGAEFSPTNPVAVTPNAPPTLEQRGEPEVLGGGLPAGAYVEIADRTKLDFSMKKSSPDGVFDYGCDLDNLARLSAMSERPDLFPEAVNSPLDRIKVGSSREVTIRFVVGDWNQVQRFSENSPPPKSAAGAPLAQIVDRLSPDARGAYAAALEKYRAQFAKQKPG